MIFPLRIFKPRHSSFITVRIRKSLLRDLDDFHLGELPWAFIKWSASIWDEGELDSNLELSEMFLFLLQSLLL